MVSVGRVEGWEPGDILRLIIIVGLLVVAVLILVVMGATKLSSRDPEMARIGVSIVVSIVGGLLVFVGAGRRGE